MVGSCFIKNKKSISEIDYIPDIDLKSISFISNGRSLDASLWFNNIDNGHIEFKNLATFEIGKINSTKYQNNFERFYDNFSDVLWNISDYNLSLHLLDVYKVYNNKKVHFFGYTYFDKFINASRLVDVYLINDNNNFYFIKFSTPFAINSLYDNEEKTVLNSFELNGKKIENSTEKKPILVAFNIEESKMYSPISDTNTEKIDKLPHDFNTTSSHIEGTSIYEDKIFNNIYNATNILYGTFPSKSIPINDKKFLMFIDVLSSYEKTFDYLVEASFNSSSSKWSNKVYQTSADKENFAPEYQKLLKTIIHNQTSNYMVPFSFDLNTANYPEQYRILFMSSIAGKDCWKNDVSSWSLVPTPDFSLNLTKNPVEIRTDESKNIQLEIHSLTNTDLTIFLYNNKSKNHSLIPTIDKSTDRISLSPFGSFAANIKINENKNMSDTKSEYPVTLPIVAKMSFPTSTVTFKNIIYPNTEEQKTIEFKYKSDIKESKEKHVDLTVLVKPKFSDWEKFTMWTNSWLNTMTGLWSFLAGIATIIGPLFYWLYKKRDKRKNNKLNNYYE